MSEKRTIELEIQDNTKTLKQQYKEAVVELQNIAAAYGETSTEAAEAAKRAAELKDQIEDTNDLLQSYKGEGTFIAMGKAMSSVASGFSAVEGGLGLIGVESENVQQAMLKVQSAMALAQGLEGLEDAGRAFKQLGSKVGDAFKSMSTAQKAFAVTGIGLLITGISLAIANMDKLKIAMGGTTQAQKDLLDAQKEGAKAMADATMSVNEVDIAFRQAKEGVISKEQALKVYNEKLGNTLGTTNDYNLAEKTFRDNTGKYIKAVQARATAQALANKAAEELAKGETAALESQVSTAEGTLGLLETYATSGLGSMDAYEQKAKDLQAEGVARAKKKAKEGYDQLNKLSEQYMMEALELESELNTTKAKVEKASTKKSNTEAENKRKAEKEATEKAHQKSIEDLKKHNEQLLNEEEANAEAIRRAKMSARELELSDIQDEYFTKIEQAKQLGEQGKDLVIKLQEEEIQKKKEINKKYDDEALAKQKAQQEAMSAIDEQETQNYITEQEIKISLLKEGLEKELAIRKLAYDQEQIDLQKRLDDKLITEQQFQALSKSNNLNYEKDIANIRQQYEKENEERKRAELERNVDFVKQGLTIIQDLTDLFGKKGIESARKAFKIKKAAQMASALIDTYMNATAAYGSQFLPIPDPSSPVRGGIAAGLAVAAGLVNVAKIGAQKFEGGGSSGGGGGGGGVSGGSLSAGGGMQAPNFNVVGNNGLNQLAQLQQQPTQAFVVSGEVTSAQSLDRNRIQNATL